MKAKSESAKTAPSEVTLRIVLQCPTAGVDFGLQKGHGSSYETVQKQRSKAKDLEFEFNVTVKPGGSEPAFSGPFVQGPFGEKFVYIDIGTYAGQTDTPWSRRLKIPLNVIAWKMIKAGHILVAHIPVPGKMASPHARMSGGEKSVHPGIGPFQKS
jgi:Family of unknown function (DUF5990)